MKWRKKKNPLLSLFIDFSFSHKKKCREFISIPVPFFVTYSFTVFFFLSNNFHGYALNECNGFIFGTWAIIIIAIVNA